MKLLRRLVLGVALVAALVVAIIFGWRAYRQWTRPDIARVGGTVLVYEVDTSRLPNDVLPADFDMGRLVTALQHRLDPAEVNGVVVRSVGEQRVEISLPRRSDHHAEDVAAAKEMIARIGSLHFVIVANTADDSDGIKAAEDYFGTGPDKPGTVDGNRLRVATLNGTVPPPPPEGPFNAGDLGRFNYSWVELGPAERIRLGLDNATGQKAEPDSFWKQMEEARQSHWVVQHATVPGTYRTNLYYSREIVNPDRLPEMLRDKKYEYFVLCRDPAQTEDGSSAAVTGDLLVKVYPTEDKQRGRAVGFTFNSQGAKRLSDLTAANKDRSLAIVLDDQIRSAPNILEPITGGTGLIHGNYTQEEVNRLVDILNAGALPAPLKPFPVSETTVEPTRK
jgi:hypothetical protein